jgi:replicative DNA helicase
VTVALVKAHGLNEPASALPHNLEAEHGLIGCVLFDNGAFERIPDSFRAEHFHEPLHGAIWEAITALVSAGRVADPVTVQDKVKDHGAYEAAGGLPYLADLFDRAPPAANAADYARVITEQARRRDLIRIAGDVDHAARKDHDADAREIIEHAEAELYSLAETGQRSGGVVTFSHALTGAVRMIGDAFERDGKLAGLSTGLIDVDQKLGGLHPSDLLILAGRPSMGKTALATNIAFNVASKYRYEAQPDGTRKTVEGGVVLFFSLEMSAEQLGMRILADVSGVSSDKLRKGEIDIRDYATVRDAAIQINDSPLFVDATGALPIAKLSARARRQKRTTGLDLIVVDYLQLVTTGRHSRESNRVAEVSEITQALKALAKELNVPVIALSQLSRQVEQREDKRPQLSDLRESGSIEQDADVVCFVYREAYYLGRAEPKPGTDEHLTWQDEMCACQGLADLIIGKQRHGPIGTVKLSFDENTTKFGNVARDGTFAARQPYGDD